MSTLAATLGDFPAFACCFAQTRWFGDEVLWLDPDPAEPFRALTAAVWAAFPQHPPYAGAHAVVTPHLTVGESRARGRAALHAAERSVQAGLPLSTQIDRVLLIAGAQAPDSWRVLQEFRLGPGVAQTR